MPPEYFKAKREEAHIQAVKDTGKITSHLLEDIHDESLSSLEERPAEITVARTMARFASLLFNLSKQGADNADKNLEITKLNLQISKTNLKLQRWLIALTIIALVLTFLAVLLAFLQFKK
jgi:hypothetical protein